MRDKAFLDTNILIYTYSVTEPEKQNIAVELLDSANSYISTQVIQEFSNILFKKFNLDWKQILFAIKETSSNFSILINNPVTIEEACRLAMKYKYSFYDSLIISAALEADCSILFTEDLQHNQLIENKLRIVNPFK